MGSKSKHGRRQPQRCGPKGASKILDAGPHALYLSGEHFAQRRDAMEALGITRVVACGCLRRRKRLWRVRSCRTLSVLAHA